MADDAQLTSLHRALARMSGLLSLDIAIKTFPDSIAGDVFHEDVVGSQDFLPELLALKTDDATVALRLVPGRPVYSVFVDDPVPSTLWQPFVLALARSTNIITQLQLRLQVHDNPGASDSLRVVQQHFPAISTLCLELDVLNPSEKPLRWASVKVSITASRRGMLTHHTA